MDAEFVGRVKDLDLLGACHDAAIVGDLVLCSSRGRGEGETALFEAFAASVGIGEVVRVAGVDGETRPYRTGVLDQLLARLSAADRRRAQSRCAGCGPSGF